MISLAMVALFGFLTYRLIKGVHQRMGVLTVLGMVTILPLFGFSLMNLGVSALMGIL